MSYFCSIHDILNIWEQPFEDADELYNHKLRLVLDFFASKLHLYYSSSRLTSLLTTIYASIDSPASVISTQHSIEDSDALVPLPPRVRAVDNAALSLCGALSYSRRLKTESLWEIFLDFLDSDHPLALDGDRYATAAWSFLNVIFKHYQLPVFCFAWFSQHYRTMGLDLEHPSTRHLFHSEAEMDFSQTVDMYWGLRTIQVPGCLDTEYSKVLRQEYEDYQAFSLQNLLSGHLQFLLERSAYSNNLLNFARHRVFRFRYLHRRHPTHMKKAIFALAKYIQRVTGSTAEVSACESIWGRKKWFTAR